MQDGFPDRGDGAGIIDVGTQIRTVIHAAEHPLCVGNEVEQAEPGAIGRCAVDCETLLSAWLDPNAVMPRDAVAHSGLCPGGRHHDRIAECAGCGYQRFEPGSINAIVIGNKKLHSKMFDLNLKPRSQAGKVVN